MAKIRRTIRKLHHVSGRSFDQQMWSVYVALILLGGYLMGIAAAFFRIDDPRLFHNAKLYLVLIPLLIVGIIVGLWRLDRMRPFNRRLTLSIVLMVTAWFILLPAMYRYRIFYEIFLDATDTAGFSMAREEVIVPEFVETAIDTQPDERRVFERPVESGVPEVEPEELARQEQEDIETPRRPETPDEPEPTPTIEDIPLDRQESSQAAPRRSDQSSQLSRQSREIELQSSESAETIETAQATQSQTAAADAAPLSRQSESSEIPENTPTDSPETVARPQSESQVARHESNRAADVESTTSPTLPRRIDQPRRLPSTDVAAAVEAPATPQETAENVPRPANPSTERQTAALPQPTESQVSPNSEASPSISAQPVERQSAAESTPTVAQTPQSARDTQRPTTAPPSAHSNADPIATTQSPNPSSPSDSPTVAPTEPSRQAPPTDSPDHLAENAAEAPSASPEATLPLSHSPRVQPNDVATLRTDSAPSDVPERSRATSELAASPQAIASPSAGETSQATSRPEAEPARTALTRSTSGTAGIGTDSNLDRGLPAPSDLPSPVASASSDRAESSQQTPAGPALSPSELSQVRHSQAGESAPQSTLHTQPVELANAPGTNEPSDRAQSAAASLQRADASAPADNLTAAAGTTDFDVGPTRIVSESGGGRASGGGQPILNQQTEGRQVARREPGGAPQPTLDADLEAAIPSAPDGIGGGSPLAPSDATVSTATVRTDNGGNLPALGDPVPSDEEGSAAPNRAADLIAETHSGRTETIEAPPGPAEAGGGSQSPERSAAGPSFEANTLADAATVAGAPDSSGEPQGAPLSTDGQRLVDATVGGSQSSTDEDIGALAGDVVADGPSVNEVAALTGQRRASPAIDDGPAASAFSESGGTTRRQTLPGISTGTSAEVATAAPSPGSSPTVSEPSIDALAGSVGDGPMTRQSASFSPAHLPAPEGPGGTGPVVTSEAGIADRRAQRESDTVHLQTARFVRQINSGPVSSSTAAITPAVAYRGRGERLGDPDGGAIGSLSPQTEEAIERGLVFVAGQQRDDGSWSLNVTSENQVEEVPLRSDMAATGLALLSFLGAGYHHQEYKYEETVSRGLEFLLSHQKETGELYLDEAALSMRFYSHAIGTITLCEAYGMTQDPRLREPAQKALDLIAQWQNEERGGWRYSPGSESDTSVTGWMVMALKSGELANLQIDDATFVRVDTWLDLAQASSSQRHLYRYNPFAPDDDEDRRTEQGRKENPTMTSVGLLMRLYRGWRRDRREMVAGADYLLEHLPAMEANRRDAYYWYYGTQLMFHMGGEYWEQWNASLRPMLLETQVNQGPFSGSWNARYPVTDRWGAHAGRLYVTTLNLLSLEVYYRHLPIHDDPTE